MITGGLVFRRAPLPALLALGLCAASPPPEGHEVSVGLGYADYQQLRLWYAAKEAVIDGGYSYRWPAGWTLRVAGSIALGQRTYVGNLDFPWRSNFAGTLSLRVGVHSRWAGIEVGPGYWVDPTESGLVPSATAWAGADKYAHVWLEFFPGHTIGDIETAGWGWGIGHAGDVARVEVGLWNSSGWGYPLAVVRIGGNVDDILWIGLRGRYMSSTDWNRHEFRIVLTVSFDPTSWAQNEP
jgi:hypothetical protein